MPLRMWWLKRMPGALKRFKQVLEHKKHGVPGTHTPTAHASTRTDTYPASVCAYVDRMQLYKLLQPLAAYYSGVAANGVHLHYCLDALHCSIVPPTPHGLHAAAVHQPSRIARHQAGSNA